MIESEIFKVILHNLRSRDTEKLLLACKQVVAHRKTFNSQQIREMANSLMSLFYLDTADHPEFQAIIDAAVDAQVALGPDAIDVLIEDLTDADIKANFIIGRTLSKMGTPALVKLIDTFKKSNDPNQKTFALFAIAKMDDPALIDFFPEVVAALDDDDAEVRDTAARAIGKIVDVFSDKTLPQEAIDHAFEKLVEKLSDPHPGTRSKAVRSIGKLAKAHYLDKEQVSRAVVAISAILGIDGKHEWDRAFVVRREAEEAYLHLTGKVIEVNGPGQQSS